MQHVDEGQIHAYLDHQLEYAEPGARAELERHVAGCAQCAALLQNERSLHGRAGELLRASDLTDLSTPPFEKVLERAATPREPAARLRKLRRTQALAWAASVILALGIGWYARASLLAPSRDLTDGFEVARPARSISPARQQRAMEEQEAPEPTAPAAETPRPSVDRSARTRPDAVADAAGMPSEPSQLAGAVAEQRRAEPEPAEAPPAARFAAQPAEAPMAAPAAEEGDQRQPTLPTNERLPVVRGVIVDRSSNRPLAGAQVSVDGLRPVTTDEDGRYTLPGAPVGEVQLRARLLGFTSATTTLRLGAEDSVTQDFELTPAAVALDEIVVAKEREIAEEDAMRVGGDTAAAGGRAFRAEVDTEWLDASLEEARQRLGTAIMIVDGLPVERVAIDSAAPAVLVVQRLASGERIQLRQYRPTSEAMAMRTGPAARRAEQRERAGQAAAAPEGTVTLEGLVVTLSGDVPADSIPALLRRLREAPAPN